MPEVYTNSGVLAPEDRLEDCAPWLPHEIGWRPPDWWLAERGRQQELSWPAAPAVPPAVAPQAVALAGGGIGRRY
jgi:hypothetical protein